MGLYGGGGGGQPDPVEVRRQSLREPINHTKQLWRLQRRQLTTWLL